MTNHKQNRGFAAMDSTRQREIASKGGQASSGNFASNPARASEAGKRGALSRALARKLGHGNQNMNLGSA